VLVVPPASPVGRDVFLGALAKVIVPALRKPLLVLAAPRVPRGVDPFGELPAGLGGLGARLGEARVAHGPETHFRDLPCRV